MQNVIIFNLDIISYYNNPSFYVHIIKYGKLDNFKHVYVQKKICVLTKC